MLLLDIGNSAVKSAQVKNRKIYKINRQPINTQDTTKIVKNIIGTTNVEKIFISNSNQKLNINDLNKLHPTIQIVRSTKSFGQLKNGYTNHQQLGSDRWLSMIYAWNKVNTACCVIDCGTCITYDQIDNTGQHLGGFILPGQNLAQNSMQDLLNTKPKLKEADLTLGKDTNSAVNNGLAFAFLNLIQGLIKNFKASSNSKDHNNIFITGGSADFILQQTKGKMIFVDNMAINGLLLIANSSNNA